MKLILRFFKHCYIVLFVKFRMSLRIGRFADAILGIFPKILLDVLFLIFDFKIQFRTISDSLIFYISIHRIIFLYRYPAKHHESFFFIMCKRFDYQKSRSDHKLCFSLIFFARFSQRQFSRPSFAKFV